MQIGPVKQYQFNFVSDGISTSLAVDASLTPINENFEGAQPIAVLQPAITSFPTGGIQGVTAALVGTTITLTFPALQATDNNGNLILYTATFYLQYE